MTNRGWACLFAGAPTLALRDFEALIRAAPDDPTGRAGRAAARILIGLTAEALDDAEASLHLGEPSPRTLYNAAGTYARAATLALAEVSRRGRSALRDARKYESRAADLLRSSVDRTPPGERDRWLREVVGPDEAIRNLRPGRASPATAGLPPLSQ